MRKLEKEQPDRNTLMKGSRKDLSFVRAAGAGGWRSDLPASPSRKNRGRMGTPDATLGI